MLFQEERYESSGKGIRRTFCPEGHCNRNGQEVGHTVKLLVKASRYRYCVPPKLAEKLPHDARSALLSGRDFASRRRLGGGADDVEGFPEVKPRKYELLDCEARHLNLLNVLVSFSKAGALRGVISTEE